LPASVGIVLRRREGFQRRARSLREYWPCFTRVSPGCGSGQSWHACRKAAIVFEL
jgi:hypothetical protein